MRQSELWSRYKFICLCQRCASTPSYVDHVLQDTIVPNLSSVTSSYNHSLHTDEAYKELRDCIDEAISDYLSSGNYESCIEKLENALAQSVSKEHLQSQHSWPNLMLHPLHHLSLNAYITLSSAYKVCAVNFLAAYSRVNSQMFTAFELSQTSVAYSLLYAGAVHHLFLSEFSLIATAANFWISAGESLLSLSKSTVWNSILKRRVLDLSLSVLPSHRHSKCLLINKLIADMDCQLSQSLSAKMEFHEISKGFTECVSRISSKVWPFLVQGNCYLKDIKDPIDYSWLIATKNSNFGKPYSLCDSDGACCCGNGLCWGCSRIAEDFAQGERIRIFQLGFHCLLYGVYLVSICYGRHCYLYDYVRNLFVEK